MEIYDVIWRYLPLALIIMEVTNHPKMKGNYCSIWREPFFSTSMIMGGRVVFWCMILVLKVMKGISQKLKEMQGPKWWMLFLGGELGRWILLVEAVLVSLREVKAIPRFCSPKAIQNFRRIIFPRLRTRLFLWEDISDQKIWDYAKMKGPKKKHFHKSSAQALD